MRRRWLVAGGAVALLVTVFAAVRVFAPTDTLDRSHEPHPASAAAYGRVYGELMHSPLFVGDRLRVYAADNRVWADGPVDAHYPTSALWAFRRWPAQLTGVVAAEHAVVSRWSDGQLVAIDPDQGRVRWRANGPAGGSYGGRRTGAQTVYDPPGLYLGTAVDGTTQVVLTVDGDSITAYTADNGTRMWHRTVPGPASCRFEYTVPGVFVVVNHCASTVNAYLTLSGSPFRWPADPALRPVGCAVGDRTMCTGLAGATGGWLINAGGGPTPAPALTGTDSWLAGRIVVHPAPDGHIEAHDPDTGKGLWAWPDGGDGFGSRILAVEPGVVHIATPDRELVNLDANSGVVLSRFPGQVLTEKTRPWAPGYVYASHGYLAIERLMPGGRPDASDGEYYYPFPTVLFTGS